MFCIKKMKMIMVFLHCYLLFVTQAKFSVALHLRRNVEQWHAMIVSIKRASLVLQMHMTRWTDIRIRQASNKYFTAGLRENIEFCTALDVILKLDAKVQN